MRKGDLSVIPLHKNARGLFLETVFAASFVSQMEVMPHLLSSTVSVVGSSLQSSFSPYIGKHDCQFIVRNTIRFHELC